MRQIAVLFLLLAGQLQAQQITTSFVPATVQGAVGSTISLELKVTGFTDILTVQFPVTFNANVLQYQSASDFSLPGFTAFNVSYQPTPTPRITVSYEANPVQFPTGVSLSAGATLMKLNFKVLADGISTVNLASNLNPVIETINKNGDPVNVSFQGGGAIVTGGTGVAPPPPLVGFHVIAGNVTANVGQQVCVPITVNDFEDIESMQFAMHFDPSRLTYTSVQNFGLQGLDASSIIVQTGTGLVNLLWADPGETINGVPIIDGVTLPDGTKIFDICFTALGPGNTTTQITIDGIGIVGGAEVINHAGQNVWTATSGVTGTVSFQAVVDPTAVTFILDTATVLQNEVKCLDFRVRNFQSIEVVQLPIIFDDTRLELLNDATYPIIIPGSGNNPLNLTLGSHISIPPISGGQGKIKLSWIDQGANGVTLPDNTKLFQLCFRAIGPVGSTNKVEVKEFVDNTSNTFIIEVRKNGVGVSVTPNLRHGHLYITNVPPCSTSAVLQSKADPKCHNGNTGSINVNANGTGNLTYAWAGPQGFSASTANISTLKPGLYTLTVSSSAGCSSTLTVTLDNPPAITATGTGSPVNCFGGNDGSINLVVSGGTGAFTFSWSGPGNFSSTAQNPTNLSAGNYTVTLTDANQCSLISSQILVATPSVVKIATAGSGVLAINNVSCAGGSDGTINFGTEGGTPPYTYAWAGPGITNPNAFPPLSNLTPGMYQVTITDNKGCSIISQSMPITAPQPINVTKDAETPVKCLGDNNGSIAISVSGGNGGYNYKWVDGSNQQVSSVQDPSGLPAGTYRVTVTDSKSCTGVLANPVTIASPAAELSVAAPTVKDVTCPGGNDGSITLNITGGWSGTPTIQWSPTLPAQPVVTGVSANNYSVTVTDAQGCSKVRTGITVNAPQAFAIQNTALTHLKCHNSGDGLISVNITGGNAPYTSVVWSPGGLSGTTISNLSGGTYVPTVTDAKQCTHVFAGITVNAPQPISVSETVVNANGTVNGSISLNVSGGTPTFNYNWSNGLPNTPNVSVPAGTYTVTISDLNNCQIVKTYVVEQLNPFIPFTASITNSTVTCFEAATACVTITLPPNIDPASKPVSITYPGLQTPIVTSNNSIEVCGLSGGIKIFTITPTIGLPVVLNVNIQTHTPVSHNEKLTNPNEDFKNGSIDLSPLFPSGNYSYDWRWFENGVVKTATTQDLINLDSGLYCVTITDLNTQCTVSDCKLLNRIWQPISGSEEITRPTCKYSTDGSIKLNLTGGRAPYQFKWSGVPGVTYPNSNTISDLRVGNYAVTVTDENGTTWTKTWTLTSRSNLSGTATVTPGPNGYDVSGPTSCDGKVTISTTGQSGTVKFLWNNGETTAINSSLCKGDWWVIVSDGLGCADTLSGTLTAPPAVVFGTNLTNYNGFNVRCHGGNDAEAAITISGGVPPYQVVWSTGFAQTIPTASGLTRQTALKAGNYSLTVTDANDVKNIHEIIITEPEEFVIDFQENLPERFTECDGSFTLISNGAAPVKFSWTSQIATGTTNQIEDLCANEKVAVLAVDANGCRATAEKRMGYPDDGCLIFRPVLTPGQSEGKNDDLFVTCIESVPDNSLEIYNRWGQLVYQVKNYDNDSKVWRGTNSKGQPLPEGVYFYILNYINSRGENLQAKGYINVLR